MRTKEDLTREACIVDFKYSDGSVVRSLCSANREIVSCSGILWRPGFLYDLEVKKPIPPSMFELDTDIFGADEENACLEPLDQFAQDFIKRTWPY